MGVIATALAQALPAFDALGESVAVNLVTTKPSTYDPETGTASEVVISYAGRLVAWEGTPTWGLAYGSLIRQPGGAGGVLYDCAGSPRASDSVDEVGGSRTWTVRDAADLTGGAGVAWYLDFGAYDE